jgi:hypothetical protein
MHTIKVEVKEEYVFIFSHVPDHSTSLDKMCNLGCILKQFGEFIFISEARGKGIGKLMPIQK